MKWVKSIFFTGHGHLREVWSVIGIMLIAALIIVVFLAAPIVGVTALTENNKCDTLSSYDNIHEYRWNLWSGCRVQTSLGYWVDADNPALIELEQGE